MKTMFKKIIKTFGLQTIAILIVAALFAILGNCDTASLLINVGFVSGTITCILIIAEKIYETWV